MEEHILSEKIDFYKNKVENRPVALLPNILLFTYLSIGKMYEDLLNQAEQFLMSSMLSSILAEDFNLLGNIATGRIDTAKRIFKNIVSLDPEDPYAHLLMATVEPEKFLNETRIFLQPSERKIINEFLGDEGKLFGKYELYRLPDIIGLKDRIPERIENALKEEPFNPILKVSFAEAMLKIGKVDEAEKEISEVLRIYPNYSRALYLHSKIVGDYRGNDKKSMEYLQKIFNLNPLSQYLKGIEVMFLNEKDDPMESELKGIFETENPFITFFKEHFKKEEIEKEEKIEKKEEQAKEEKEASAQKAFVPEEEKQAPVVQKEPIDRGFESLDKGDYQSAIKEFLKELKKE